SVCVRLPMERQGPGDRPRHERAAGVAGRGPRGEARLGDQRLRRAPDRVRDPADRGLLEARGRARRRPSDRAALERRALAARHPDGRGGDAPARRLLGDGSEAARGALARSGARSEGEEDARVALVAHCAVVGGSGEVVAAGTSEVVDGGRLIVDLKGKLAPGAYRVLLALALNGNLVNPEVKVIPYRVAE